MRRMPTLRNSIPALRLRQVNDAPVEPSRSYVLYWMIASRRCDYNFALDRAIDWARELGKPLMVLEPLRCGYRWASDRLHRFVIDGMAENARRFENTGVYYYPYVEPKAGAGKGLLDAVARHAAVVVTDDYPCFFLPRMVRAAGRKLPVRLEAVDGNGLLPLRAVDKIYPTAYSFRRVLQKTLPSHFDDFPRRNPLARLNLPERKQRPQGTSEWPPATAALLEGRGDELAGLPIDHEVPAAELTGGHRAARLRLTRFLGEHLPRYDERRNHPDEDVTSGLSPYLHFGHISSHEVFSELMDHEGWTTGRISTRADGRREGWWGAGKSAEAFLDQLVTWRELGLNMTWQRDDYDRFDSLPDWAIATLEEHASDERRYTYELDRFERARTHDALWNAAQNQLRREGRLHNYLRMLWGKKILEWTPNPRRALDVMLTLNDKYALDGRDPNSISGIFWVLGRYDRPWGPEREIFGKIRYMSSENTRRKLNVKSYLTRYGEGQGRLL